MPFYEELIHATQAEQAELQATPIIRKALEGQVTLQQYVGFLTQAYHHVKHTTPLLMACGARMAVDREPLLESIAYYIEGEIGHQEWILNDISACGADANAVRHGKPAIETELMVAYAYDIIARGNPAGLFGMVHVLEGTSVQLATRAASVLGKSLNLPEQAFSYLTTHGSLDLEHVAFFRDLINRLDSAEDKAAIVHAARVFFRLYGDIFRTLETIQ